MFTSGISAIILAALVFGGYAVVIVTSKRIFDKLNNAHLSERTKRLQKQLAIIMLSQVSNIRSNTDGLCNMANKIV